MSTANDEARETMRTRGPAISYIVTVLLAALASLTAAQQWPEAHPPAGQQPRRPAGYTPFRYPRTPQQIWRDETASLTERARASRQDLQTTIARGPFKGTLESIARHRAPDWFLDAKFGMFVDWGPWSVAGWAPKAEKATYPDWYEQRLFKEFRDYHAKVWGDDIKPDDLIELLQARELNPASLASLAKAAGMRYVVPFLKHHGGYCLWDSSFTHRDSVEWGIHCDVASEMGRTFRAEGLRYGAYVSLGEWNYPIVKDGALWTFGKGTRGHAGWGDFYTSEYHVIQGFEPHPWEESIAQPLVRLQLGGVARRPLRLERRRLARPSAPRCGQRRQSAADGEPRRQRPRAAEPGAAASVPGRLARTIWRGNLRDASGRTR
jgi:hypothetical protein